MSTLNHGVFITVGARAANVDTKIIGEPLGHVSKNPFAMIPLSKRTFACASHDNNQEYCDSDVSTLDGHHFQSEIDLTRLERRRRTSLA